MLGWMVLIRNLMQIFPTARLIPQCYCTCWLGFLLGCFERRWPQRGARLIQSTSRAFRDLGAVVAPRGKRLPEVPNRAASCHAGQRPLPGLEKRETLIG